MKSVWITPLLSTLFLENLTNYANGIDSAREKEVREGREGKISSPFPFLRFAQGQALSFLSLPVKERVIAIVT